VPGRDAALRPGTARLCSDQFHHRPFVNRPVDIVADPVRLVRGEGAIDRSQDDPQQEIDLAVFRSQPDSSGIGKPLVSAAAEHLDRFDDVGIVTERDPDTVAQSPRRLSAHHEAARVLRPPRPSRRAGHSAPYGRNRTADLEQQNAMKCLYLETRARTRSGRKEHGRQLVESRHGTRSLSRSRVASPERELNLCARTGSAAVRIVPDRAQSRYVVVEVLSRQRACGAGKASGRALVHDMSALRSCAGADVDDVVGVSDDARVVFDDDEGGTVVDEAVEQTKQRGDVTAMHAGGGLIEHEPEVRSARGCDEVAGEAQALTFSA